MTDRELIERAWICAVRAEREAGKLITEKGGDLLRLAQHARELSCAAQELERRQIGVRPVNDCKCGEE